MNRGHCTRVTPAAGISVLGLGIALAASACGAATSSAAAQAGNASATASTPAAPASTTPISTTPASSTPGASASSAPASSTTAPIPIDGPYVMWNCENKPEVRPTSFVLACADGNDRLLSMHWANWVPTSAAGTGVQYLNDCTPNCAIGHFHSYPADIALTGSYHAGPDEPFAYTKITLTYTGARPTVYVRVNGKVEATHPATWSQVLPLYHPAA